MLVGRTCWILTISFLNVKFGFDEHPQSVHLFPLQFIQLSPKIVVDKVQLFGKFALLQAECQHNTVQLKVHMFQNGGL